MLKFLDNRPEDKSPKHSLIANKPQMCFGNSYETPTEFQTPFTIYHRPSYINPFLKFEEKRMKKVPNNRAGDLQPMWTRKANLSLIEEHKILANPEDSPPKSRYLQSFYKQFEKDPKRFNITQGECSKFIDKNNHYYKSIGPMQGIERTNERITARQQSVWIKSPSKKNQMTASLKYATSLTTSFKSSIGENSQMLTQKKRIRKNREHIRRSFWNDLNQRKKLNTSVKFQLPRNNPEHQIYLAEDGKQLKSGVRKQTKYIQTSEEINSFEKKMSKYFK